MIQLTPVSSSQIHAVGYDQVEQRLHIAFKSNPEKIYTYNATPDEHQALIAADSIGKYFSAHFKKRSFTTSNQ